MTDNVEAAKRAAATEAVKNHWPHNPPPRYVGIGSGTTIVYVVEAIKKSGADVSGVSFVPTGYQSAKLIYDAGLSICRFEDLQQGVKLDVAFDGADEVDEDLNCIKGGGACLFQEKLVAMRAKEFVCVADYRKLQNRLLTNWKTIPIEVAPIAAHQVMGRLKALGAIRSFIREGVIAKVGPIKTDQDFYIVDAEFSRLLIGEDIMAGAEGKGAGGTWEVEHLARAIKDISGVLEVGIFCGPTGPEAARAEVVGGQRPIACYFGMQDGSVTVRTARSKRHSVVASYPLLAPTASKAEIQ